MIQSVSSAAGPSSYMRLENASMCVCHVCGRESCEPSPLMALDQYCRFRSFSIDNCARSYGCMDSVTLITRTNTFWQHVPTRASQAERTVRAHSRGGTRLPFDRVVVHLHRGNGQKMLSNMRRETLHLFALQNLQIWHTCHPRACGRILYHLIRICPKKTP